jgi:hypothetical protein
MMEWRVLAETDSLAGGTRYIRDKRKKLAMLPSFSNSYFPATILRPNLSCLFLQQLPENLVPRVRRQCAALRGVSELAETSRKLHILLYARLVLVDLRNLDNPHFLLAINDLLGKFYRQFRDSAACRSGTLPYSNPWEACFRECDASVRLREE